jgi:hypothetical protein
MMSRRRELLEFSWMLLVMVLLSVAARGLTKPPKLLELVNIYD